MTVLFDLRAVLELAEHAVTAPIHLYCPDRSVVDGEAALTLAVSDTIYLVTASVPDLQERVGVPRAVFAETDSVDVDAWHTEPHQLVRLDFDQSRTVALRFLPLQRPADRPVIDLMRAAARAGWTHITVDPADLSVAVMRRRRRTRTSVN
jgi:hypothetical protein